MHPNEIDLTKFDETQLEVFRLTVRSGLSDAHLEAFEEQLKRQIEKKSK